MRANVLRWFGIGSLVVAMVGTALWQWRAHQAMVQWDPDTARGANQPIPVRTVKVEKKDLEETIGGTAVTMPALIATITIPLSSSEVADRQVKAVNDWPGSEVKRGKTVIEFEPALYKQVVQEREAVLSQTTQALDTMQKLFVQKAASGLQVESAKVDKETAKLKLDLAQRDLDLCVINSPIDGVVDQVNVVPQGQVSGGTTLAVITQLDPIYVQMDFPMERIDGLKLGQNADIVLDAFPQETFKGKVLRISPVVSTKSRVLPVTIEVANPANRIKAGIAGFVRIKSIKSAATSVPTVSVIKKQQKSMVVCVENNRAKVREVRTGAVIKEGEIEVLDGVKAGEVVVVYGQKDVQENDLVNVDWLKWTHRDDVIVPAN
ncbi:MAG TPA: efflux RND transporter periplasmic adaptor subunit [Lacipirellulaceae bacterium]|jgi:RND family efflux transporter MFP subunit|nr:efflux RND transporter periplasmic adaptor subunit [Lacipirellulaceae bacterium]